MLIIGFSANMMRLSALCDILYKRLRNTLTYLLSFCKHFMNVRNNCVVTQRFNNFATVINNETVIGSFM